MPRSQPLSAALGGGWGPARSPLGGGKERPADRPAGLQERLVRAVRRRRCSPRRTTRTRCSTAAAAQLHYAAHILLRPAHPQRSSRRSWCWSSPPFLGGANRKSAAGSAASSSRGGWLSRPWQHVPQSAEHAAAAVARGVSAACTGFVAELPRTLRCTCAPESRVWEARGHSYLHIGLIRLAMS